MFDDEGNGREIEEPQELLMPLLGPSNSRMICASSAFLGCYPRKISPGESESLLTYPSPYLLALVHLSPNNQPMLLFRARDLSIPPKNRRPQGRPTAYWQCPELCRPSTPTAH